MRRRPSPGGGAAAADEGAGAGAAVPEAGGPPGGGKDAEAGPDRDAALQRHDDQPGQRNAERHCPGRAGDAGNPLNHMTSGCDPS